MTSLTSARKAFLDDLTAQVRLAGRSQNTLKTYAARLEFFERAVGPLELQDITAAVVTDYLVRLKEGALPDSRKATSESYVANHWRHLVAWFKWLKRRGYELHPSLFERDDMGRSRTTIVRPLEPESEPNPWTDEELEAIRASARSIGPREQVAVELLLRTGMRLAEVVNLRLENILDDAIRVERSKSTRGGRIKPMRYAPLWPELKRMIAIYVDRYRSPMEPLPYLLLTSSGHRLTQAGADSMLDRIHHRAGVKGGSYRYRDTFATEFLRKNPGQFKKLKDYLGHAEFSTTERYARFRRSDVSLAEEDPFA